jgi:hypothetical protein
MGASAGGPGAQPVRRIAMPIPAQGQPDQSFSVVACGLRYPRVPKSTAPAPQASRQSSGWALGTLAPVISSYSSDAADASPRRGAIPLTLRTRTPAWSTIVTTSPHLTSRPGAVTRTPLTRTCPAVTRAAAAVRVRTTRAFHSHRSIRCRSPDTGPPPQRRSLAAASSCALRAASLANGELGSACFSRSRCGVKSRRSL